MKEHQRLALERGLLEFDRTVARKRTRRRAVTAGALVLALGGAAFVATRFDLWKKRTTDQTVVARHPLPSYVEVIANDAQLTAELELASACERIGRSAGRIYVMECTRSGGGK